MAARLKAPGDMPDTRATTVFKVRSEVARGVHATERMWFAGYRNLRTIEENRRSLAAIVDRLANHLVSLGFADTPMDV